MAGVVAGEVDGLEAAQELAEGAEGLFGEAAAGVGRVLVRLGDQQASASEQANPTKSPARVTASGKVSA